MVINVALLGFSSGEFVNRQPKKLAHSMPEQERG